MKKNPLLAGLLAAIGIQAEAAPAVVPAVEAVADEALVTLQASFDAFKLEAEAQAADLTAKLTTAIEHVRSAGEQVEALQASLAAIGAEKAAMEAAAAAAKLAARNDRILAAVGTERAPALQAAFATLEDSAFDAAVAALVTSGEIEGKSRFFREAGVAAEADPAKTIEMSKEMQILLAEFPPKNKG